MAKITSKSQLNAGTEIVIDTTNKTVQLVATGNLVAKDGVTVQAVYSKLVDLWNTATYNNYDFPMYAKDALAGEYIIGYNGTTYNGWSWKDTSTRQYLRDGGWSEYNSSGVLQKVYVGLYGLGTLASSGSQAYYQIASGGTATNFSYTDMPNEAIKVYDVGASLDSRTYAKVFIRTYGYTYTEWTMTQSGFSGTGAYKIPFVLNNSVDSKIQANDATVSTTAPYTGITTTWITGNGFTAALVGSLVANDVRQDNAGRWFICTSPGTIDAAGVANYTNNGGSATLAAYSGERQIGSSYYAFNIIVDGNNASKEKIYTKVQYLLRQNSDIDSGSGTRTGQITAALMSFAGDTLTTSAGVYIDNYLIADKNNLQFTDVNGTVRTNPFAVNGTLSFDTHLTAGGAGKYRLFFTTNPSGNFPGASAVTVNDASGNPITGTISGSSIVFTYDYDGNSQGGRTPGTDAAVTLVACNPGYSKYSITTATISRTSTTTIPIDGEENLGYVTPTSVNYTFTGSSKDIALSAGTTSFSVLDMTSRWHDWLIQSDNFKYIRAMNTVGGQDIDVVEGTSIPIYCYLDNGWKITPDNANHTLKITGGILLTDDGTEPFNTVSGKTVRIVYQQPVQAITVTSSSGGTGTESDYLNTSTGEILTPL